MTTLTINGLDELGKKLSNIKHMEIAKKIVQVNGKELKGKMVRNAVFTKGYSTGQTRQGISYEQGSGGMSATVKPNTEYSPYVEYGTRFMAAQPFVGPSFNAQKEQFKNDLRRLVD